MKFLSKDFPLALVILWMGLGCFGILSPSVSLSEEDLITQRIALPIRIEQEIDEVLCVGKSAGKIIVSRGMFNLIESSPAATPREASSAMVGCGFSSSLDADGTISVIVNLSSGIPSVYGVRTDSVLDYQILLDSEEKAGQKLLKQREILASYQVQAKTQDRALVRLRSDADLIGTKTGFSQLKAQYRALRSEATATDRELQNIESSIQQIKSQPAPANSAAREIEITKQLAELAQVARGAEQAHQQQQNDSTSELSASMRLIEEARFEQPDQIRAELIKVRRRRQELEETLQEHTQSSLDYE